MNVFVDGAYLFSLDIAQVASLGVVSGKDYSDEQLAQLQDESQFGKLYMRALEYCFVRPRSERELKDYLYRKTRPTRTKTGALKDGYSQSLTERVFASLQAKGHVDDEKFARFWVENRNLRKGISARKLHSELMAKGVSNTISHAVMQASNRDETQDLQKILAKKAYAYDNQQKLIAYLARQGFQYDDIKQALADFFSDSA